jgi:WD40 repeat protein
VGERFDAFVSYSHAADGRLAAELQRGLQRLAKPVFARRSLRVFRDETGLSTNPHLWGSIETALSSSEWFVFLASPEAAGSEWVIKELTAWLASKPLERILVVVTDGHLGFTSDAVVDRQLTTCLPEVLIDALAGEPRWLDLRWARQESQLDLRNGRFRAAVADLAAPIHGIPKDDLESDDVRQQRRARRLAVGGVAAISIFAVASLVAALVAVGKQHEADSQRREAAAQRDLAEQQRSRADAESVKAKAKALAAQAAALSPSDIDLGLLLGVEGYQRDPSLDTKTGLLTALDNARGVDRLIRTLGPAKVDIEVSPDRGTAYIAYGDGTVRATSTSTWATDSTPVISGLANILGIDLSKDGSHLAVLADGGAIVIDMRDRHVVQRGVGGATTDSISLNDDGSLLAMGSTADPVVQVWDVASGTKVFEAQASDGSAAFLPDRRLAVVSLGSTTVSVYSLDSDGSSPLVSSQQGPPATGVIVSPDGATFVVAGLDGTAQLMKSSTLEQVGTRFKVRGSRASDVFFNDDGSILGLGSDDGSTQLIDAASGSPILEMAGMTGAVLSEFVSHSAVISIGFYDDAATSWSPERASQLGEAHVVGPDVNGVFDAGDGNIVYSVDGELRVAPAGDLTHPSHTKAVSDFNRLFTTHAGIAAVYGFLLDTDGSLKDRTLVTLRLPDLAVVATVSLGEHSVEGLAVSPDGASVAVGFRDGSFSVYDTATGRQQFTPIPVDIYPCCVGAVVWSADGSRLFVGGQDGTLRTFDTSTWKQTAQQVLAADQSALRFSRLSPDGSRVIVPSESGSVFLIDATTGTSVGEPYIAAGTQLQNAVIAASGAVVAAVGRDGKLRLWDAETHRSLGPPLAGHAGFAASLDILSDGSLVTGGSADGRLITWTLDPDQWAARACTVAGRNLTHAEWDRYVGGAYSVTCPQFPAGS